MTKILPLILAIVLCTSCTKQYCWECNVDTGGVQYSETFCDRSKKEIADLQQKPLETKDKAGQVIYTTYFSNCSRR